ncbi:hypothetical protein NMG60_11003816 [Bertholletia excelsa]
MAFFHYYQGNSTTNVDQKVDPSKISRSGDGLFSLKHSDEELDFKCMYCFKSFPSAQSLGGHQNAHRRERMEKRRYVKQYPLALRKRPSFHPFRPVNALPPPSFQAITPQNVVQQVATWPVKPLITSAEHSGCFILCLPEDNSQPDHTITIGSTPYYECGEGSSRVAFDLQRDTFSEVPDEATVAASGGISFNVAEERDNSPMLDLSLKL